MLPRHALPVLALLAVASPAGATVVVDQSLEELTASASLVIRGTAGPSEAKWDERRKRIQTWTTVRVTEVLKGEAGASVRVRQPGGIVGEVGQLVEGAVRFQPDEEVLLFLEHPGDNGWVYVVSGMSLGKFSIQRGPLGAPPRAIRDTKGVGLYAPRKGLVRRPGGPEDAGPVDALVERIRRAAAGKAGGR
jgi:hypothetical protein